ncbi:hypothetical protein ACFL95_006152, partial [Klebsiella oxytoca]
HAGEQHLVVEALRQSCDFRGTRLAHAGLPPVAAKADADISARAGVNTDGPHAMGARAVTVFPE